MKRRSHNNKNKLYLLVHTLGLTRCHWSNISHHNWSLTSVQWLITDLRLHNVISVCSDSAQGSKPYSMCLKHKDGCSRGGTDSKQCQCMVSCLAATNILLSIYANSTLLKWIKSLFALDKIMNISIIVWTSVNSKFFYNQKWQCFQVPPMS